MTDVRVSPAEFQLLRQYIEEQCGIALTDDKTYLIETRLTKLMVQHGCDDFGAFYRLAKSNSQPGLRDKIVDAMTTNETLWFRDNHPFTIVSEKLLPEFTELVRQGKRFRYRIWSAACSTGQEPYSLAITIQEFCRKTTGVTPGHFEIIGTDISPSTLFVATAGRYDAIAMSRGLPEDIKARYFEPAGRVWALNESTRRMVTFKQFNLQNAPDSLGPFDLVLLRYVAIYFSDAFKKRLFENLARVLTPGGHLIIGAVESLRGYTSAFETLNHAGGAYHRKV